MLAIIGSANRDPKANKKPNLFDVTRTDIKHVAFGHGIHLCLGLNLARLEAKVAITALLARFPDMTLADQEIIWTKIPLVRGMETLLIDVNDRSENFVPAEQADLPRQKASPKASIQQGHTEVQLVD